MHLRMRADGMGRLLTTGRPSLPRNAAVRRRRIAASATSSAVTTTTIADGLVLPKALVGMWQVSGGHGYRVERDAGVRDMKALYDKGLTAFDMADHYGPAEDLFGIFKDQLEASRQFRKDGDAPLLGLTKWVPMPGKMERAFVQGNIDKSRRRMHVDSLDMMQFHWWDYGDRRFIDALKHMQDMKEEGILTALSLTNFNTEYASYVMDHSVSIATNQVSYSIVDRRPEKAMVPLCESSGMKLITYGSLLGGYLSDAWLGKREPNALFGSGPSTASQNKYKQFIDRWGGWKKFQQLLKGMATIAKKHGVSISNVAVRYVMQKPQVSLDPIPHPHSPPSIPFSFLPSL